MFTVSTVAVRYYIEIQGLWKKTNAGIEWLDYLWLKGLRKWINNSAKNQFLVEVSRKEIIQDRREVK